MELLDKVTLGGNFVRVESNVARLVGWRGEDELFGGSYVDIVQTFFVEVVLTVDGYFSVRGDDRVSLRVDVNPASAIFPTEMRACCCMEGKMWVVRAASGWSWKIRRPGSHPPSMTPLSSPRTEK